MVKFYVCRLFRFAVYFSPLFVTSVSYAQITTSSDSSIVLKQSSAFNFNAISFSLITNNTLLSQTSNFELLGIDCSALTAFVYGNVYVGGNVVKYNNKKYTANWWNQNDYPTAGTGAWTYNDDCNTGPIINAGADATICKGGSQALGGSPTASGGTSPYAYTWAASSGSAPSGANPIVTPTVTTTYSLTVTDNVSATSTDNVIVFVNNPTITYSNACSGQTLQLNCAQSVATTYVWAGPASFSSGSVQNPTRASTSSAHNGTYSVTVTLNALQCSTTASVTVNSVPSAPTVTNDGPKCAGTSLVLTSTASTSYSWAGPASFTSALQNPMRASITASHAGNYTITITDANGCTNSALTAVTIYTATAGNNAQGCVGGSVGLISSGGGTYAWAGPNSYTTTTQNPTRSSLVAGDAGTYTVTVTNSGLGCTATTDVTVNASCSDNCTSCDITLVNWDGLSFTANNQKACVASGTTWNSALSGTLSYSGCKLVVCGTWAGTASGTNYIVSIATGATHSGNLDGDNLTYNNWGTVTGAMQFYSSKTSVDITNYGAFTNTSASQIFNPKTSSTFLNKAGATFTAQQLDLNHGATFTNNGSVTLSYSGSSSIIIGNDATNGVGVLNNNATLTATNSTTTTISGQLNTGSTSITTFNNGTADLQVSGSSAKITNQSKNFAVNFSSCSNKVYFNAGADLDNQNSSVFSINNGGLQFDGAGVTATNIGIIDASDCTGWFTNTSTITNSGNILLQNFSMDGPSTSFTNNCLLTISGDFTLSNGTINGPTSGDIGHFDVAGVSTKASGGTFGGASQIMDFCDPNGTGNPTTAPYGWNSWTTGTPGGTYTNCAGTPSTNTNATCVNVFLPVELISFTALCNAKGGIELIWITATETNNAHFIIERLKGDGSYEDIAIAAGKGNSNTIQTYSVTDNYPNASTNYYRLVQVDFDGKRNVYTPIAAECNSSSALFDLKFYFTQNANTMLSFAVQGVNEDIVTFEIFNINGQLIDQFPHYVINNQLTAVMLNTPLANGLYVVRLSSSNQSISKKLLIAGH